MQQRSEAMEVALFWGDALLDVQRAPERGSVRMGDALEIARGLDAGSFAVKLPDGAVSIVRGGDGVEAGPFTLVTRPVTGSAVPRFALADRMDVEFLSWLAIAALAGGFVWKAFGLSDRSHLPWEEGLAKRPDSFQTFVPVKPPPVPKKTSFAAPSGQPAPKPAGTAGRKDAPERASGGKGLQAKDAGLLAVLGGLDSVFSGQGPSLNEAFAGVRRDDRLTDSRGLDGITVRGNGPGGGGKVIGLNGIGGPGNGPGGTGRDRFGFAPGEWKPSKLQVVRTNELDGLDPSVVARVIKRHWNEIRHCYEKALSRDPNLVGKVAVQFDIGPTGEVTVANVAEATLDSSEAQACMLSSVRRWKFPAPRGGGVVQVRYPFVFTTNGG